MAVRDLTTAKLPAPLPPAALLLALLYKRLGGSFSISSKARRYYGRPEPALFEIDGGHLPHLADAQPHEKFRNADQWKGAIMFIEAVLQRLDDEDTELIFDLFATVAVDGRTLTPSIEEPKRSEQ